MVNKIIDYFKKPCVMAICSDVNQGKSNLIYYIIEQLKANYDFKLVTFALRYGIKGTEVINSLAQLEIIKDSIVILDEFYTLFDLDDRKKRRQIERTLRLINHNNNILVLCGTPDNYKKYISDKISVFFYKKSKLSGYINGSCAKNNLMSYEGTGMGSSMLSLGKAETLVFDGDYKIFYVPYLKKYDSKLKNAKLFVPKKLCAKNVQSKTGDDKNGTKS